mgnify:FL=1
MLAGEWAVAITIAITTLIGVFSRVIRRSRCSRIKCFCVEMEREVLTEDEVILDIINENETLP